MKQNKDNFVTWSIRFCHGNILLQFVDVTDHPNINDVNSTDNFDKPWLFYHEGTQEQCEKAKK